MKKNVSGLSGEEEKLALDIINRDQPIKYLGKWDDLRDSIQVAISSYSPEYLSMSEEADTYLKGLVDSIRRFEDECLDYARYEKEKYE